MEKHKEFISHSNESIGAVLIEKGLISEDGIKAANEKLVATVESEDIKESSILKSLIYDLKTLEESKLLDFIEEEYHLRFIHLAQVKLGSLRPINVDLQSCQATLTVPFDLVEGTHFLATCHYMSKPVVEYWNELLKGNVIWYGTTLASIHYALENISEIHVKEDAALAEEEG